MKKFLVNFLRTIWRIWFYILFSLVVLIGSPILLVVTAKEDWYPIFFKVAKAWAKVILFGMGFRVEKQVLQRVEKNKSYIFIANHTSMIDIMLMLAAADNPFVFVGKEELSKIPVFGFFYKRTCILVNRDDMTSRQKVFAEAQRRINTGLSICIFPEGLVPSDETVVLDSFKRGAFKLAIEHQLPIVPMVFYDCKKRFSYTFFSGCPGKLRVKIHPFFNVESFTVKDINPLKDKAFQLIYSDLISENING